MFLKGKTKRKLTSSQAHIQHALHAHHTYAYMYGKVYTCIHCACKSHLSKFCYSRLYESQKYLVWENINPLGPKKIRRRTHWTYLM